MTLTKRARIILFLAVLNIAVNIYWSDSDYQARLGEVRVLGHALLAITNGIVMTLAYDISVMVWNLAFRVERIEKALSLARGVGKLPPPATAALDSPFIAPPDTEGV